MNYDIAEVAIDRLIHMFKLREWTYDIEDLVEDIGEALKHIGAAKVFEERVANVTINSFVGKLPLGCENIRFVNNRDTDYRESGSFIEMDVPDGTEVQVYYQGMPLDERGYPLVPDNAAVREALVWYMAKILVLQGELKTVGFQAAEAEWQWRCKSARAELNVPNGRMVSAMHESFTSLNPIPSQHASSYNQAVKNLKS